MNCEWAPRHLPVVTYSRQLRHFWRKRYWVRCFTCDLILGPFGRGEGADACRRALESR